jgi:hypothetical protein
MDKKTVKIKSMKMGKQAETSLERLLTLLGDNISLPNVLESILEQ